MGFVEKQPIRMQGQFFGELYGVGQQLLVGIQNEIKIWWGCLEVLGHGPRICQPHPPP